MQRLAWEVICWRLTNFKIIKSATFNYADAVYTVQGSSPVSAMTALLVRIIARVKFEN